MKRRGISCECKQSTGKTEEEDGENARESWKLFHGIR